MRMLPDPDHLDLLSLRNEHLGPELSPYVGFPIGLLCVLYQTLAGPRHRILKVRQRDNSASATARLSYLRAL
jgi:hypothetical protein